jgi:DNA primase
MGYTELDNDLPARIKEQADIVQVIGECVDLKKAGVRFLGCCPFHNEKTPSFSVHPGQQFFHCFGCGASGDVLEFQMKYHNLDFPTAMKELARRYQIEIPEKSMSPQEQEKRHRRKLMYAVNEKVMSIWKECLHQSGLAVEGRKYLQERGIPLTIQKQFGLGYAPSPDVAGWDYLGSKLKGEEHQVAIELGLLVKKEKGGTYDRFRDRVLFPIYDRQGKVLGFGGRVIGEGQPKYMNSPESQIFNKSASLLGLYQQGDEIRRRKQAILVEGNFDLVSLVVHGCPNVVAPLGTALTAQQLKLLKGYAEDCVLLFDGDSAGVKAAMRSVPLFLSEEIAGKVALLPEGHDPDTFIREKGLAALEGLLAEAMPLPEFALQQLVKEHGLTLDGKGRIIRDLQPLLRAARSSLQRSLMLSHFSESIGVSVGDLGSAMVSMPPPPVMPLQRIMPKEDRSPERLTPLTSSQKRIVTHIVLYPDSVAKLEHAGLRNWLSGTIGEVLLLQLGALLETAGSVTPEDLLDHLPQGGERLFVSDILLSSSEDSSGLSYQGNDGEITELLAKLERDQLLQKSKALEEKIYTSRAENNYEKQCAYALEKVKIDQQLQDIRKKNVVF